MRPLRCLLRPHDWWPRETEHFRYLMGDERLCRRCGTAQVKTATGWAPAPREPRP